MSDLSGNINGILYLGGNELITLCSDKKAYFWDTSINGITARFRKPIHELLLEGVGFNVVTILD